MSKELGEILRSARIAKGLDIKDVADHVGVTSSAVSQWEAGKTKPGIANLNLACKYLEIDGRGLIGLFDQIVAPGIRTNGETSQSYQNIESRKVFRGGQSQQEVVAAQNAPDFRSLQGLARDVPVRGIAVGGEDADFHMNGQDNDWAIRPPGLAGVRGLFALVVSNDSMYPAWKPNATFYINPNRVPQIGDDVVVEMLPDETGEPGKAFLKRLKARTPTKIIVEQFNPPKDLEFARDEVRLHRVVPWEEALGIS